MPPDLRVANRSLEGKNVAMSHEPSNVRERSRQSPLRRRIDVGVHTKRADLLESTEPVPTDSGVPTSEFSLESQADSLSIPYWQDLQNHDVSREFVERISVGFARQHAILAFHADDAEDESANVAIGSMESWPTLDVVGRILGRPVRPVLAPEDRILTAINAAYQQQQGQAASAVQVARQAGAAGRGQSGRGQSGRGGGV